MAFGLGVLRHSPAQFWMMTPRELHQASAGVYGRAIVAPQQLVLRNLMTLFPDEPQIHVRKKD